MKTFDLAHQKGYPFSLDDIEHLATRDSEILSAWLGELHRVSGKDVILIQGLRTVSSVIQKGWVSIQGELLECRNTLPVGFDILEAHFKIVDADVETVTWGDGANRDSRFTRIVELYKTVNPVPGVDFQYATSDPIERVWFKALPKSSSYSLNSADHLATAKAVSDLAMVVEALFDVNWVNLALEANWSALLGHTPQVEKDARERVTLKGWVQAGAGAGALVATLPAGYRPAVDINFIVANNQNNDSVAVAVLANGEVRVLTPTDNMAYCLDSISFYAEP